MARYKKRLLRRTASLKKHIILFPQTNALLYIKIESFSF